MNLLAHAVLSEHHTEWLIGNFLGDFVKGNPAAARHGLTPGEVAGVRLHRTIDSFTDAHPSVAAVREILRPRCHKYAGVAADVLFDHCLALRFTTLTGESLPGFSLYVYATLEQHRHRLPDAAQRMLQAMIRYDWFAQYRTREGLAQTLTNLSRRIPHPSGLAEASEDFEQNFDQIMGHFLYFWPLLTAHCRHFTQSLQTTS